MSLLVPDTGLLFWMIITFGLVFFVLARYGFPVIVRMVEERQAYIAKSIEVADQANRQLESIKAEAEKIITEARREQLKIINQASQSAEQIVQDAKDNAATEGAKLLELAKIQIKTEKDDAIRHVRSYIATLSVDVAQRVLRDKLDDTDQQRAMIYRMIDEMEAPKS